MTSEPFHLLLDRATADTWQAIEHLPFLEALGSGRLDESRFAFFIAQDVHYLDGFASVLRHGASLAPDQATRAFLASRADNVARVEQALHGTFAPRLGLDVAKVRAAEPAPVTVAYLDHLHAVAGRGTLGEVVAAVLPCYWVYRCVGLRLMESPPPHELYATWASAYASPAFGDALDQQIVLLDRLASEAGAEERARMQRWFRRSLRYEWMFWDQADRGLAWPVP